MLHKLETTVKYTSIVELHVHPELVRSFGKNDSAAHPIQNSIHELIHPHSQEDLLVFLSAHCTLPQIQPE